MRRLSLGLFLAAMLFVQALSIRNADAQTYISAVGNPSFGVNLPVPNGYINIANGNLHLEVPLATHKQRGNLQLNERLVYDSRIWEIVHYSGYYWWPINVPNSSAGWRFVEGNETGTLATASSSASQLSCTGGGAGGLAVSTSAASPGASLPTYYYYSYTTYYNWTDPAGTVHTFDTPWFYTQSLPVGCRGGGNAPTQPSTTVTGYAIDASGYQIKMSGSPTTAPTTVQVLDSSGNQVYPQVIDRFGNYWSNDASGNLIDDLGRTPVIATTNGNVTYYDVLAPNGPISNNGTRVRYTVTYENVTLLTAFNQSGVTEYQNNGTHSPTIPAIQSIGLPDGSSYQFSYDSYGEIQSVTLPAGGVVTYGWSNYTDSYQNVNRWISQSTIAGYSTLYTPSVVTQCASNGTGCQESVKVHRPSGDETVYTMTLNNGAWDTNTTVYAGAASANQAKLSKLATYNFSTACPAAICNGAMDVTKTYETDTLPDAGVSSQTQTVFANPATGQITSMAQWDFYPTGSTPSTKPTRQVNYGYTGFDLTLETHLDAAGNTASSTNYNYTTTATPTSGVVAHGTANAGGPYLTSVVGWNNVPTTLEPASLTTSYTYEDTGSVLSVTDPKMNTPTTVKYDPTHTFVTETDKPSTTTGGTTFSHVTKASYDPGSGVILSSDDENSVANGQAYQVKYTYEAVAGRPYQILLPKAAPSDPVGGSTTYAYPNFNEVDVTVAQTSTVNVTTARVADGYGRLSTTTSGGISSTQTYDGNGRAYSVTTPSSGSATTNGTTYTYYDALDRVSSVVNADGTSKTLVVTGNVALATDELLHQNKQVFNAFGELTSVFEADPNSGALVLETDYTRDALGNVTCIEQHGNVSGTGCSSAPSSDANSAWRVRRFFYNSLSQLRAASIPEHTFLPSYPPQQNCGTGTGGTQWTDCYYYDPNGNQTSTVDNRGVTRTYTYDALNRPLLKTSPNGTTEDLLYDSATNGRGLLATESNDVNAASRFAYDTLGRPITEAECRPSNCPTGTYLSTTATYDLAGNRLSLTYPDGRTVGSSYDSLNRLSTVTYKSWGANSVGSTYWSAASYTAPGLLQTANYGNGVQMQAAFNSRLSLTSLSYQSTSPAPAQTFFSKTYQWDKNASNLVGESNLVSSQQRQFGYDKLNRLVSAVDMTVTAAHATGTATITGVERSTQDCTGGGGLTTQLSSNTASPAISKCITIWDTGSVYITVGTYSVSTAYGQGSTTAKLAASLGALLNASGSPVTATVSGATITLTSIAQGASANYALSYSSDGDFNVNFSGATMTGGTSGQPLQGGMSQQYTLDAWGNLSSMGSAGFNKFVNPHNQVSGFTYDAAGRLTNDSLIYTYDDDGMLKTSSDGTSYVYDALGARAQVASGGISKEYYYFAGQLVATSNGAAIPIWTDYIYAGGQKIAVVAGNQTAVPMYTLPDHLGSEVASANSNDTAAALDYTPFGQVFSGSSTDKFIFTGLERDSDGLDHAGFRQYSSATGRWTTPDPYSGSYSFGNPQTFNRYSYINNMPLRATDPQGLFGEDIYTIFVDVTEVDVDSGFDPVADIAGAAFLLGDIALDLFAGDLFAPAFHGNIKAEREGKSTRTPSNANRILQCASKLANQFSIAGVLGVDEEAHPVLAAFSSAFLGNTFSGISDTITHVATGHLGTAYGDFALGGTAQGLPIGSTASSKGLAGVVTEATVNVLTRPGSVLSGVTGVAVELGEEGLAGPVGLAKLGIDGAVYLGALAYCRSHP
jgi:RHS repeat-associated protein